MTAAVAEGLARLEALAERAASSVIPHLERIGIAEYRGFLATMYHYTLRSGEKTSRAAEVCPTEDLKVWFRHMYEEEKGHYRLAEADLQALGFAPDPETPASVAELDRWWASIGAENYAAWVGALVVFENIAGHAARAVGDLVRRLGLGKGESRWLSVHVEADAGHGKEALEMGARYLAIDAQSVLAGAERACEIWIRIFRSAFEDPPRVHPR